MLHGEKRVVFVNPSQHLTVFIAEVEILFVDKNSNPAEQMASVNRKTADFLMGI